MHVCQHLVVDIQIGNSCGGFVSVEPYSVRGAGILYIAGMVLDPHIHGQGIGPLLAQQAIETVKACGLPVDLIAGRTQNPRVARSRRHYVEGGNIYPIDAHADLLMQEAAATIQGTLEQNSCLEHDSLIVRHAYGVPRFQTRPLSGDDNIDQFFTANVGPLDAVYIMGKAIT